MSHRPNSLSSLESEISAFFDAEGPLARVSPGYVFRQAQVDMAMRIAKSIDQDASLVVEASTGTGKSFAYLVAALLSKKRTIVSTATKTLQDQLFQKDLPVVIKALGAFGVKLPTALVLKGRNNYACLKKIDERALQPGLFNGEHDKRVDDVLAWVKTTKTGDFAELEHMPEDSPVFTALDARSEHCVGSACSFYNDCFVTQQRRQAQKVDLLIINHALLCTDGAIRAKSSHAENDETLQDAQSAVTSQILPDFDLWIIDEAHAFPDVATRNFGISLSVKEMRQLTNDVLYLAAFFSKRLQDTLKTISFELVRNFADFIEMLLGGQSSAPLRLSEGMNPDSQRAFFAVLETLREMDVALIQAAQQQSDFSAELKILSRRVHDVLVQLTYIGQGAAEKNGYLIVAENDARGQVLSAWPISPGHILKTHLWNLEIPVVMTSATLAFNGSTRSFRRQIGIDDDDEGSNDGLILPSIFDFDNRSALYVAKHLSNPNDSTFSLQCQEEIKFLVEMSQGGALVLFTSHRALSETYFALKDHFIQRGLKVFKQGDAPKLALIREFERADQLDGGVLFATHSFWEGVDIPGKALRLVIVDRLPFHSVADPLFEARMNDYERKGFAPFQDLALPEAALTLKQGFGRLLRKDSDSGVAAILDPRILTKGYGRLILKTLPSMPLFTKREDLEAVWRHHITKLLGANDGHA